MAKVTWLGEDVGKIAGPSFTTAFGDIHFDKGIPVEITDLEIITKAKRNQYFKVEDTSHEEPAKRGPGRPPNPVFMKPAQPDHDDKD